MMRSQIRTLAVVAAVAAASLGGAAALTACGSAGPSARTTAPASAQPGTQTGAGYAYYRSMMQPYFGGSMMGSGSYGWMMGPAGYRWMTGTTGVPGWMSGGYLPAVMMGRAMMGASTDPGSSWGACGRTRPGPGSALPPQPGSARRSPQVPT